MSTRVSASARLSAAGRQQLHEQLGLHPDAAVELGHLKAFLDSERIDVPALQEVISAETISSVLSMLAPGTYGRIRELLAGAENAASDQQALVGLVRAEMAGAVAAADARIAAAMRDITAAAFTQAGAELDYTVSLCRGMTATGVELRRGHEVVLLRIHDGGDMDFDHDGLFDARCEQRQLRLEQGVERRGITLARRHQRYRDAASGGELVAAARVLGDANPVWATVPDIEQAAASAPTYRTVTGARAEGERPRPRPIRRRGLA